MTLSVTSMSMSMSQNDLSRGRVETQGLLATTDWEHGPLRSDLTCHVSTLQAITKVYPRPGIELPGHRCASGLHLKNKVLNDL